MKVVIHDQNSGKPMIEMDRGSLNYGSFGTFFCEIQFII